MKIKDWNRTVERLLKIRTSHRYNDVSKVVVINPRNLI